MRTKHLFFAAALAASFTACTSDEIVDVQQQSVSTVGRAAVENVQLNFVGEGVGSRLAFDGSYAWEATDTIGALLMDQPANTGKKWHELYNLSQFVNTSYPFTYNTEDKTWSCPGKMLEGNYFFAYPFSSYDGGRTMIHSLLNQTQNGLKSNVVREALAAHQLFIGYSQIKKGTAFDVLNDVEMTSVLGALQLRIKNTGDKTYHVNKFVIKGSDIISELTFNPTTAKYEGTLPEDEATLPTGLDAKFSYNNGFNYANYVADEENKTVYGISEENAKYYNRAEALRKVVTAGDDARDVIYLNVEGTEAERAWAKGQTAYALVMVNPLAEFEGNITVEVYTDEGAFEVIGNLSQAETLNNEPIVALLPGVSATVVDVCDFETEVETEKFEIYTDEDMLQFIAWNKSLTTTVPVTATLHTDIELTKAMFDDMKSAAKVTWNFVGAEADDEVEVASEGEEVEETAYKFILAEDLPVNVLNYKKMIINNNLDVVVEGTINFTQTVAVDEITIEEGAVMNVNVAVNNKTTAETDVKLPKVINKGTLNIAGVQVLGAWNITNEAEGIVNVAADADVKGAIDVSGADGNRSLINKGTINNAAYMQYVKNNAGGVINLTGAAVLKNITNAAENKAEKLAEGKIYAAAGTSVSGSNSGLIACADNTVTISSNIGGRVALEVTGGPIAKEAYKNLNYNTLIIKGATTFADIQTGINYIITTDGSELKLAAAAATYSLGLTSLEINGATTITTVLSGTTKNEVKTAALNIKKGATLTNNGILKVTGTAADSYINEGLVINNQTAQLPAAGVAAPGSWKYNLPTTYDAGHSHTAAVGVEVNYASLATKNLEKAIEYAQKNSGCGNASHVNSNEYVKNLIIANATVDMTADATTANTKNSNYKQALEKTVTLGTNGKITNLAPSMAVTMTELVVNGYAEVSGTDKMPVVKVNKLTVNKEGVLNIPSGYIEMNVTAQEGMGCEYIKIEGGIDGFIVAKDADGKYLYWNVKEGTWGTKNNESKINYTLVANANDLSTAMTNGGIIVLNNDVETTDLLNVSKDLIFNLNGKDLKRSTAGNVFSVKENTKLTIVGEGEVTNKVSSDANKNYALVYAYYKGEIVIESGTFIAGKSETGVGAAAVQAKDGKVYIKGGNFEWTAGSTGAHQEAYSSLLLAKDGEGKIEVTGGTFKNFNPANCNGTKNANYVKSGSKVKLQNLRTNEVYDNTPECAKKFEVIATASWANDNILYTVY